MKSLFYIATSYTFCNFEHIKVPAKCPQEKDKHIPLHCKLSIKSCVGLDYNCFWSCIVNTTRFCILSFGWFPGVWILCANISEHVLSSIFIGGVSRKNNLDEIAFLDIHIYRKTDGSLGHEAYWKPTHINLYQHWNSQHHPAIKQSDLASWYTQPKLSVTKTPLIKNRNFSPPFSRIMDTALSRNNELLNLQHGLPRPTTDPPQLHSYLKPRQHMADSAESLLNTIFWAKPLPA